VAAPKVTATAIAVDDFESVLAGKVVGGAKVADILGSRTTASGRQRFQTRSRITVERDGLEYEAVSLVDLDGESYQGVLLYSPIPKNVREQLAAKNVVMPWSALSIQPGSTPSSLRLEMLGQGVAEDVNFVNDGTVQVHDRAGPRATATDGCISCIKDQLRSIACEAAAIGISCATGIGCPGSVMAVIIKAVIGETTSLTCSQIQIMACAVQCSLPTITLTPNSNTVFPPSTIPIQVGISGGSFLQGNWVAVVQGLNVVFFSIGAGASDRYNWSATPGTYTILGGNIPISASVPWIKASTNVVVKSANVPPNATFTVSTNGLTASFIDTSRDSDGSISARLWNFGDGTTSTSINPVKSYATAGTRLVSLTVTDNQGATGSTSQSVTVSQTQTGSCTGFLYSGSLSQGAAVVQPNGNSYYSGTSGTHAGRLAGPSGTNFDLYLYQWNGTAWVNVGSGTTTSSSENVSYFGGASYYYWLVYARQGAGSYSLCISHP
jgi:PKD repeat protein